MIRTLTAAALLAAISTPALGAIALQGDFIPTGTPVDPTTVITAAMLSDQSGVRMVQATGIVQFNTSTLLGPPDGTILPFIALAIRDLNDPVGTPSPAGVRFVPEADGGIAPTATFDSSGNPVAVSDVAFLVSDTQLRFILDSGTTFAEGDVVEFAFTIETPAGFVPGFDVIIPSPSAIALAAIGGIAAIRRKR